MTVKPGQRGINYHFTVVDPRGMRHDAYDLMDAHTLSDQLACKWLGGCRIEDAQGNIIAYRHYFNV